MIEYFLIDLENIQLEDMEIDLNMDIDIDLNIDFEIDVDLDGLDLTLLHLINHALHGIIYLSATSNKKSTFDRASFLPAELVKS